LTAIELPLDGIPELAAAWSGDGNLFDALAASDGEESLPEDLDTDWSPGQIRKRSQRVLLGKLADLIEKWPSSVGGWEEYLPVTTTAERTASPAVRGRVDWVQTVRRGGWPPRQFVQRQRRRSTDEVVRTATAWLSQRLDAALRAVSQPAAFSPDLVKRVEGPIGVLSAVVRESMADTNPVQPDRLDILSMKAAGYPWRSVALAAAETARLASDVSALAYELVHAELGPELAWRMFHLSVFGVVVASLREARCQLRWLAPLAPGTPGPQISIRAEDGTAWDLWYEAKGARNRYGVGGGPYPEAVSSVRGVGSPIGADIALVRPGDRALLLECKWSDKPPYVGRTGYHQASSYALDARSGLAAEVWSLVVGPQEFVAGTSITMLPAEALGVVLGSTCVPGVRGVVRAFLSRDPALLS